MANPSPELIKFIDDSQELTSKLEKSWDCPYCGASRKTIIILNHEWMLTEANRTVQCGLCKKQWVESFKFLTAWCQQ